MLSWYKAICFSLSRSHARSLSLILVCIEIHTICVWWLDFMRLSLPFVGAVATISTITTTCTTRFAFAFAVAVCLPQLFACSCHFNKATQKFYFFGRNSYGACFIIIGLMRKRERIWHLKFCDRNEMDRRITKLNRWKLTEAYSVLKRRRHITTTTKMLKCM